MSIEIDKACSTFSTVWCDKQLTVPVHVLDDVDVAICIAVFGYCQSMSSVICDASCDKTTYHAVFT